MLPLIGAPSLVGGEVLIGVTIGGGLRVSLVAVTPAAASLGCCIFRRNFRRNFLAQLIASRSAFLLLLVQSSRKSLIQLPSHDSSCTVLVEL